MSTYLVTPNTQTNGIYSGQCFVFDSSGGFVIDQSFPQINLAPITPLATYDVTEAIQIYFSVRKLNDQLGIIKDECNNVVLEILNYDLNNQKLNSDTATIDSDTFLNSINTTSIVSMGNLSTLYSDFNYTVMKYFSDPYGFASLFAYNNFQVNNGVFDAASYINLINGVNFTVEGSYITDLSGAFTVSNINNLLWNVCASNVFGNRKGTNDISYSIINGFIEGDLIFIPNGMNITLNIDIESEPYLNIPDEGSVNLTNINSQINYTDTKYNVSKITEYSATNITQTFSVPILLILTNKDTFNINNFGNNWEDVTSDSIGPRNWLAVSLSATGQYQCAVNSDGDIYFSNRFGNDTSWSYIYTIGAIPEYELNRSLSNSVAISATGQYITACNGSKIFVSNNFGKSGSWTNALSIPTNNIFVCISLNGKYQQVVSCGDTMYTSTNYGVNWKKISDIKNSIFNSVTAFQFAGISVSYNGQYQTLACQRIYISSDYGANWTTTHVVPNDDFDDRNWTGVSISSNGQYQSAVDSNGKIYISSSYGNTWNPVTSDVVGDNFWTSIAVSANGRFQTALTDGANGQIYVSLDYGNTWKISSSQIVQNLNFQAVSISANAQYQTAVVNGGAIYNSNLV
jgi:photosystem II stability/assembly factor-like uncharacterized protein